MFVRYKCNGLQIFVRYMVEAITRQHVSDWKCCFLRLVHAHMHNVYVFKYILVQSVPIKFDS